MLPPGRLRPTETPTPERKPRRSRRGGCHLGLAKFNPENKGPIVVKGIVIAALIHATYNTLVSTLPSILPFWNILTLLGFVAVFDGIVGYALYRKLSRYRSYYRRAGEGRDESAGSADDPAEA
jgi:hypothetical protein